MDTYDLPENPLDSASTIDPNSWMVLEYLPLGTLRKFLTLAKLKIPLENRLPNRLLWRLFLCCKEFLIWRLHIITYLPNHRVLYDQTD